MLKVESLKSKVEGWARPVFKAARYVMLVLILTVFPASPLQAQDRVPVVPFPQEVELPGGYFTPGRAPVRLHLSGLEEGTGRVIEEQIREAFRERYGLDVVPVQPDAPAGARVTPEGARDTIEGVPEKGATIWIASGTTDPGTASGTATRTATPTATGTTNETVSETVRGTASGTPGGKVASTDNSNGTGTGLEGLGEEGYLLEIGNGQIHIRANGNAGAFYGVQTLRQLLRGCRPPEQVPQLRIRDWPDLAFRCVMDDISRGPVPTREYMRQQVRRYAEMKINRMSFYIEHVIRTKAYPDLAPTGGGISVEEFRELSDYAKDYNIRLVGNFQSLGHFEKILSLPQFRHLGATDRMLDPLNPESMEFLEAIYAEMAPAFSSEYFTPNLDEAWDLTRGELSGAADSLGPARIWAMHATRIDSVLRTLGKKTIVWGDIVLEHPEVLEMIPRDVVMGAWDYSPSERFAQFIDPLADAGFQFTVSPGILNSNRLIPDYRMTTANIRNFINEGYDKGALGVYFTVWDDGGAHFFSHDWYGVACDAEQSWRPNRDPQEDFDGRFSRGIYGDPARVIPRFIHSLNPLTDLGPTYEMNYNVFNKSLVPERGARTTVDPGAWEEVSRWLDEAEPVLKESSTPAYPEDLDFFRFTLAQYRFLAGAGKTLAEAAGAYNRASSLQRDDRQEAAALVRKAAGMAKDLADGFRALTVDFSRLWDRESRPYWKDRALLEYRVHQEALDDLERLLGMAAFTLEKGGYLPPPTEVRLDIRVQEGQYFEYWLTCGSFTIPAFDDYLTDFLEPMGGEAAARPFPGMAFTDAGGTRRTWSKYDSPTRGQLDFTTIFEPHTTAVAYVYCTIDSPDQREVTALLGSNDGATVWCNGRQVYQFRNHETQKETLYLCRCPCWSGAVNVQHAASGPGPDELRGCGAEAGGAAGTHRNGRLYFPGAHR